MKAFSLLMAAGVATLDSLPLHIAEAQVIKIDGSSTVFPVTEAVAEEFQNKKRGKVKRDGRHLRHRRRLQEVLPRRDRHAGRLAPDPEGRDGGLPRGGIEYIELPIAFDALTVVVNPQNNWVTQMTRRGAEEDVGAGGPGQDHAAGTRSPTGRTRRSSSSAPAPTPARSITSPRRSSARPSPAAATTPPARTTTCWSRASPATRTRSATSLTPTTRRTQAELKAVAIVDKTGQAGRPVARERDQRHLQPAVAAAVHLRQQKSCRAARGQGVRRVLPEEAPSR